jgi:hypothetical protein
LALENPVLDHKCLASSILKAYENADMHNKNTSEISFFIMIYYMPIINLCPIT